MNGIDISSYQGQPNFDEVKASGLVDFCYAKCTEGIQFNDDQYMRNRAECKVRGIPFGAYHFFHFDQSPVQQAEHFFRTARLENGDLVPMVDVEVAPSGASLATMISALSSFLQHIEDKSRVGQRLVIYTGYAFWGSTMGGSDAFAGHPLWIAEYNSDPAPTLPQGWNDWKIWQYSSTGTIPGITGDVDMDRSNGDLGKVALN